jgi:hypothetical protein
MDVIHHAAAYPSKNPRHIHPTELAKSSESRFSSLASKLSAKFFLPMRSLSLDLPVNPCKRGLLCQIPIVLLADLHYF